MKLATNVLLYRFNFLLVPTTINALLHQIFGTAVLTIVFRYASFKMLCSKFEFQSQKNTTNVSEMHILETWHKLCVIEHTEWQVMQPNDLPVAIKISFGTIHYCSKLLQLCCYVLENGYLITTILLLKFPFILTMSTLLSQAHPILRTQCSTPDITGLITFVNDSFSSAFRLRKWSICFSSPVSLACSAY